MRHADFTTLFELAAGLLKKGARRREAEAHVSACSRCADDAESARRLFTTVRSDRMVEPPALLVSRAVALWHSERPGQVRKAVAAIRALLTFDSFTAPLPVTVRSAPAGARSGAAGRTTARSRRLLYTAGDYEIDVAVEPARTPKGRPSLRGQVLPRDPGSVLPAGAEVRLARGASRSATIPLDDRGAFAMGSLAPGRYRLTVHAGSVRLIVDRLEVP